MSKTTTTISFRCPPDILDQIDSIGREHFPKTDNSKTNSGCDRSKTLFAIIQAGIAVLTDGEVPVLQSRLTDKENSKTDINLDEVEGLVKKLISQNNPVIPDEWELSQLIRKEIENSLEEGHIAAKIQDIRDGFVANFNEFSDNFIGRLAKVEGALLENKKPEPTTTKPELVAPVDNLTTSADKTKLITLLRLEKILSGDLYNADTLKKDGYFKAIADNKAEIAKISGIEVKLAEDLADMNAIINWLGYKSIRTTHKKISYRKVTGKHE